MQALGVAPHAPARPQGKAVRLKNGRLCVVAMARVVYVRGGGMRGT